MYISSAAGIQVFDKNGTSLRIINIPETPTNVAFGGKDWKTLFITAGTSLYSIQLDKAGIPLYTSVPEITTNELIVFPNPTNGILHVGLKKYNSLKIYNISGQEVMSKTSRVSPKTIDLSSLQNGYYIVKIEAGKVVYSTKVLIQK